MAKERRINLRFSEELYEQLDRKRFEEKTSFQAIGSALFVDWVRGKRKANPFELAGEFTQEEISRVEGLVRWLREEDNPGLLAVLDSIILSSKEAGKKKTSRRSA